jgi:hypothetical protein
MIELSHLPLLKFALMLSLISKLMVTCLDDRMVNTRNVRKDCMVRTEFTVFSILIELSPLSLLKFVLMLSLISKLMVTCLDDRMVNTHNV